MLQSRQSAGSDRDGHNVKTLLKAKYKCLTSSQPHLGNLSYTETPWEDKEKGNTRRSATALWARRWDTITGARRRDRACSSVLP